MPARRPPFTEAEWAEIEARDAARNQMPVDWHRPRGRGEDGPKKPLPWASITNADIEAWRRRDLAERWATEDGIAKCLTWLEREFGHAEQHAAARG